MVVPKPDAGVATKPVEGKLEVPNPVEEPTPNPDEGLFAPKPGVLANPEDEPNTGAVAAGWLPNVEFEKGVDWKPVGAPNG